MFQTTAVDLDVFGFTCQFFLHKEPFPIKRVNFDLSFM